MKAIYRTDGFGAEEKGETHEESESETVI